MKKIFALVLSLICVFALSSCYINSNKVKLKSLTCEKANEVHQMGYVVPLNSLSEDKVDLEYQYLVVSQSDKYIDMKIELENPNDYHIFDFNLKCSDNSKILLNGEYQPINEQKSINWLGDTNSLFIIHLLLEEDLEQTDLQITNILFANRSDGKTKLSANLNNKNDYSIYRVKGLENVYNGYDFENDKYVLDLTHIDERISVSSFIVDNEEIEYEDYLTNKSLVDFDKFVLNYKVKYTDDLEIKYTNTFEFNVEDFFKATCNSNSVSVIQNTLEETINENYTYSVFIDDVKMEGANTSNTTINLSTPCGRNYVCFITYKKFNIKVEYNG